MRAPRSIVAFGLAVVIALLPLQALAQVHGPTGEFKQALERIETRLEAWDVEGAKQALAAAEKVAPDDAEPLLYYQGRIAFEDGRYDDAIALLERAGVQDKPGSYLRLARDTREVVDGYETQESPHFIFQYPKGKDAVLAPYALEALEAIRQALLDDLGHAPPGKVRVEVVSNAKELARVSTLTFEQIRTTGTIAICKFNKLMVTSPKAVLRGYDWLDTLAHEYVHLVVSQKSENTVPIWLHEGLAKYLESRWRGEPGKAMTPSMQALLGRRVKQNKLIPFEKMHPSIALLPTAEDAATAFAEVFYAIDLLHTRHGVGALRTTIEALRAGKTDRAAVEQATGTPFPQFEKAWLTHVKKQKFPAELLPMTEEHVVLKEDAPGAAQKDRKKGKKEISFGDFAEVTEVEARKWAHLGEIMRERNRSRAAAEHFGKAHQVVGDKYQAISDKYALALLETGDVEKAEQVLIGSLRVHPGVAATLVHLGRIYIARRDWERARTAFLEALAADPFDPEIHVSLVGVHDRLQQPKLKERAHAHAMILTRRPAEEVHQLVQMVMQRSGTALATTAVEPGADEDAAASPSPPKSPPPDAGEKRL